MQKEIMKNNFVIKEKDSILQEKDSQIQKIIQEKESQIQKNTTGEGI